MVTLAPDIFLATVGDRSVVLDLRRDRYLGLGRGLTQAVRRLVDDQPVDADGDVATLDRARAQLLAQGILTEVGAAAPARYALPATATLWSGSASPEEVLPWSRQGSALWALAQAQLYLRTRSFHATMIALRRFRAGRHPRAPQVSLEALLEVFAQARPWFPVRPICRLDAIALCLLCWRNDHPVDLVFGVRLEPFGAHCWVQRGQTVLNEAHESVERYTPIMVI